MRVEDRLVITVAEGLDAGIRLVESIDRDMVHVRLSAPGRLVASYVTSRFLSKDRPTADVNEVEVLDATSGEMVARVPFEATLDGLGFAPDDAHLVITVQHVQGPMFVSVETGEVREALHNPSWDDPVTRSVTDDKYLTCHAWRFSSDGHWLAVGGRIPYLFAAPAWENRPLEFGLGGGRCEGIRFSADGRRLVVGDDEGHLLIFRI